MRMAVSNFLDTEDKQGTGIRALTCDQNHFLVNSAAPEDGRRHQADAKGIDGALYVALCRECGGLAFAPSIDCLPHTRYTIQKARMPLLFEGVRGRIISICRGYPDIARCSPMYV